MKFQGYPVTKKILVTSNTTTLTDVIPKGHQLMTASIYNREAVSVTNVSLSTSVGGKEIISDETILASSYIDVPVNRVLSPTLDKTLYFTCTEVLSVGVYVILTMQFAYTI